MQRAQGLQLADFAQTLRRAHCSHADAGEEHHRCIGKCTITNDGVQLDCKACGNDSQPIAPTPHEAKAARAVVEAAGLAWECLTPQAQSAACAAALKASLRW